MIGEDDELAAGVALPKEPLPALQGAALGASLHEWEANALATSVSPLVALAASQPLCRLLAPSGQSSLPELCSGRRKSSS